jgi:hypothetical protein
VLHRDGELAADALRDLLVVIRGLPVRRLSIVVVGRNRLAARDEQATPLPLLVEPLDERSWDCDVGSLLLREQGGRI